MPQNARPKWEKERILNIPLQADPQKEPEITSLSFLFSRFTQLKKNRGKTRKRKRSPRTEPQSQWGAIPSRVKAREPSPTRAAANVAEKSQMRNPICVSCSKTSRGVSYPRKAPGPSHCRVLEKGPPSSLPSSSFSFFLERDMRKRGGDFQTAMIGGGGGWELR